jgi:hypothetical protein
MSVSVYVDGYKFYYTADKIELAEVRWHYREVVMLVNPKECYDESLNDEVDESGVSGTVYIPKDKITHVIVWD